MQQLLQKQLEKDDQKRQQQVDEEWDAAQTAVECMFRGAYRRALDNDEFEDGIERQYFRAQLEMKARKGGQGKLVRETLPIYQEDDATTARLRKQTRHVRRCRELIRQLKAGNAGMATWWQQHRTLCERVLQQKGVSE